MQVSFLHAAVIETIAPDFQPSANEAEAFLLMTKAEIKAYTTPTPTVRALMPIYSAR